MAKPTSKIPGLPGLPKSSKAPGSAPVMPKVKVAVKPPVAKMPKAPVMPKPTKQFNPLSPASAGLGGVVAPPKRRGGGGAGSGNAGTAI